MVAVHEARGPRKREVMWQLPQRMTRLDVYVRDGKGTVYNVEMQVADTHELPKRTRFYQSLMALGQIKKGEPYNNLGDSYVMFPCGFDPFHLGERVYFFENACRTRPDLTLGNGAKTVFPALLGRRHSLPACEPPSGAPTMKPHTPDRRTLTLALIGLAFLWPCLESFVTMRFRASLAFSAFSLPTDWGRIIVCCSVLASTAAMGALYAKGAVPGPNATRRTMAALGLLACAGNMVFAQASLLGTAVTPLAVTGLVIVGIFITVSVLAWGTLLSSMPARHALLVTLLSNILSFGAQALLNALEGDALLYVLAICPLVTAACWIACQHVPAPRTPKKEPLAESLRRLPWHTLLLTFALICFEDIFSRLLFSRHEGWSRDTLGMTLLLCGAVCFILTVIVWRGRTAQKALALALPILLALYMAALLITVLIPDSPILIAERTMVAVGTTSRVYLWLLLTYECCARGAAPIPAFMVYCALVLSVPYSSVFSFSLELHNPGAAPADIWQPGAIVSLAAIALFVVAMLAMAASNRGREAVSDTGLDHSGDIDAFAHEAGLSEREGQVLALLARGFSAKVAAQRLGLAESTVVTHTTHIYRKLGVASRQELLQLLDSRIAPR